MTKAVPAPPAGLFGRYAAVPLILMMIASILTTRIPILIGSDWLIFHVNPLERYGFWSFAHETRTDWPMLLGERRTCP